MYTLKYSSKINEGVVKMLSLSECTSISEKIFSDPDTLDASRFRPEYFTRTRNFPFKSVLKYLISLRKGSAQNTLNDFFDVEGKKAVSQQALSKARSKFSELPFKKVFKTIVKASYDDAHISGLKRFHGKFLIAIDGSLLTLPNIPELGRIFGNMGNSPKARISIGCDILNDLVMDADIDEISFGEGIQARFHIVEIGKIIDLKEAIFIFDRGYPSRDLINDLYHKSHFLMRLKNKFNKEIDALGLGSHIITPYDRNQPIRVVKINLDSDEIETLITNLFDLDEADFKDLYFKRWSVETKYDIVKNKLELPNFTGFSPNVIYQDFWISMYMLNVAAIAKYESDMLIKEERLHKSNKYQYQTNVNNLIGTLRSKFANAVFFATEEERNKIIQDIIQKIKRAVVPIDRDRSKVRRGKIRTAKFHHNRKSNL